MPSTIFTLILKYLPPIIKFLKYVSSLAWAGSASSGLFSFPRKILSKTFILNVSNCPARSWRVVVSALHLRHKGNFCMTQTSGKFTFPSLISTQKSCKTDAVFWTIRFGIGLEVCLQQSWQTANCFNGAVDISEKFSTVAISNGQMSQVLTFEVFQK